MEMMIKYENYEIKDGKKGRCGMLFAPQVSRSSSSSRQRSNASRVRSRKSDSGNVVKVRVVTKTMKVREMPRKNSSLLYRPGSGSQRRLR
jgi:hypothetical protein